MRLFGGLSAALAVIFLTAIWMRGDFDLDPPRPEAPVAEPHDGLEGPTVMRSAADSRDRVSVATATQHADAENAECTDPTGKRDLSIRVVDADTREGVPELELILLEDGLRSGSYFTDDSGYAEVLVPGEVARVEIGMIDAGRRWSEWSEPWDVTASLAAGNVELAVPIGPTYFLDIASEVSTSKRLTARLMDAGEPLATTVPTAIRKREDGAVWVRFGPAATGDLANLGPEWIVRVESSGGQAGQAVVDSVRGIHPQPLRIQMQPTGSVHGIVGLCGGRVLGRHQVEIRRERKRVRTMLSDDEGRFALDGLAPGSYELQSRFGLLPKLRVPVEVLAGDDLEQPLSFPVPENGGSLSGRLLTQSGARGPNGIVSLRSAQGGFFFPTRIEWTPAPPFEGQFTFDALAPGTYELEFVLDSFVRVRGGNIQELAGPGDAGEFLLLDEEGAADCHITAVDDSTGDPIASFSAWMSVDDAMRRHWTEEGRIVLKSVPTAHAWEWLIEAEGYQPVRMDGCTVTQQGDRVLLRARLAPGWGAIVHAMDEDHRPVVGLRILGDDLELGTTNERGSLLARAPARPSRLSVLTTGWAVAEMSDVSPEDGTFTEAHAFINLYLRPTR